MLERFKTRFDPYDWFARLSAERTAHALSAGVYLMLSLLAAMQVLSPGAVQRIAAQTAGEVLLIAVAAFLLLLAGIALGSWVMLQPGPAAAPGGSHALLHFALAVAGLDLAVGHSLLSGVARSLSIGGLGLALVATGAALLLSAALPERTGGGTPHQEKVHAIRRRDHFVRGGVLAVLGALLFGVAVDSLPGGTVTLVSAPWGLPLVVATGAALFAYGLHALWMLRQEGQLWQA